jgi:hypothetical protein
MLALAGASSNAAVGSEINFASAAAPASLQFLDDGVMKLKDAKCLEATLCNPNEQEVCAKCFTKAGGEYIHFDTESSDSWTVEFRANIKSDSTNDDRFLMGAGGWHSQKPNYPLNSNNGNTTPSNVPRDLLSAFATNSDCEETRRHLQR